jgi:predicted RecA/RadA family phage recombinase
MAQSYSEGQVFNYTTTGAVANGELKVLNRMPGVALTAAAGSGEKIALAVEGVFSLAAVASGVKTAGLRAMYRSTGGQLKITTVSGVAGTGKLSVGTIWETATAAATSVKVKLIGGPMANLFE